MNAGTLPLITKARSTFAHLPIGAYIPARTFADQTAEKFNSLTKRPHDKPILDLPLSFLIESRVQRRRCSVNELRAMKFWLRNRFQRGPIRRAVAWRGSVRNAARKLQ